MTLEEINIALVDELAGIQASQSMYFLQHGKFQQLLKYPSNFDISVQIMIDEYMSASGPGYLVTVISDEHFKVVNVGPEEGLNQDWI